MIAAGTAVRTAPAAPGIAMRYVALAATFLLAAAACDSTTDIDDRWAIPENIDFADVLDIDLSQMNRTESGLYWQDLVVSTQGAAIELDDRVRLHFTIWLPDGTVVENTHVTGAVQSDVRLLIPGIAEAITGVSADTGLPQDDLPAMHVGSRRKLVIRPELAWGNRGTERIPPRTTIVSEIEIISIVGS